MATLPAPLLDVTPLDCDQAGPSGNDPTAVQAARALGDSSESAAVRCSRRFWEQERQMARTDPRRAKGSPQRAAAIREAYDTVATFREAILGSAEALPVMGLNRRYTQLVGQILRRQQAAGMRPALFEVGYGFGQLLKQVVEMGFPATGIEVSPALRRRALELLGPEHDANLLLGNLRMSRGGRPAALQPGLLERRLRTHSARRDSGFFCARSTPCSFPAGSC